MSTACTFDDVLIRPKFSLLESRRDTDLTRTLPGLGTFRLPVISANMDTITDVAMAQAMRRQGAQACLHRFCSIEANVAMLQACQDESAPVLPWVSVGLGATELERARALQAAGATCFVVDVAHAAQMGVVRQVQSLRAALGEAVSLVVGNFATGDTVTAFLQHAEVRVDAVKVGIGPGSACTTRIKTGVGYPQLSAIQDVVAAVTGQQICVIADGGMRTPGSIAKALGAGATLVMLGGMLAGTDETPGDTVQRDDGTGPSAFKRYRGSASKESYGLQGKDASWRTAEGEAFWVPARGPVAQVLQDIEGGLRSALTYVGAANLAQFRDLVHFTRISAATAAENGAHGKRHG